jgi:hypothetical protein
MLIWFMMIIILTNVFAISKAGTSHQPSIDTVVDTSNHRMPEEKPNVVFYDGVETETETKTEKEKVKATFTIPEPYCPAIEDNLQNDKLATFSLDSKTKPYESYIKKLSPIDSFKMIQTNTL